MKNFLAGLLLVAFSMPVAAQDIDPAKAFQLISANSKTLGLLPEDISNSRISSAYHNQTAGTDMVYLQQTYLGLPVHNQIQSLAFKNGSLVSAFGQRIAGMPKRVGPAAIPTLMPETAVQNAIRAKKGTPPSTLQGEVISNTHINYGKMGIAHENITAQLMWLPENTGKDIYLVWQVYFVPRNASDYWYIYIDAHTGEQRYEENLTVYCDFGHPHSAGAAETCTAENIADVSGSMAVAGPDGTNIVGTANYRVVPYPAESPNHPGGTPSLVTNPWELAPGNATTLGWHNDGFADYAITRGNNVYAQEDRDGDNSTFGNPAVSTTFPDPLNFNFVPDFTVTPTQTTPIQNQQFNITNLFYWNNIAHDISYLYGFDEPAGNFQASNMGRGGQGNDYVIADAQDASGSNNANFATPPDGQRPRMQMFLYGSAAGLQRDASVDNGIVVHEFGHGISNRLTGGPNQGGCLQSAEQMGEGWSDYFALMYTQNWATSTLTSGETPRGMATYAHGQSPNGPGNRSKRYSTNFAINDLVYGTSIPAQVHDRGELWCAVLWDMTWNIIQQVGNINPTLFNTSNNGGNSIALKLVMEGMKLQPCNPGFIDGRDAILQADQILYGGQFECAIREAFRRRGMGLYASQGSAFSVTDQQPDFSSNTRVVLSQGGMTEVGEGQNIVYTNTVFATCEELVNYELRDTLPANVTWVSGGTYDASTRVVSWPVNIPAGGVQTYTFTVTVNAGSYFPTTNLFEETVPGAAFPASLTNQSTPAGTGDWRVSSTASHSPSHSMFAPNLSVSADQRLFNTNAIALPPGSSPKMDVWHRFATEEGWDGGVMEISTNNGLTWRDLGPNMIAGLYTGQLGVSPLNVLSGRKAFTGTSNGQFINTIAKLSQFAGLNVKLRFRFASDGSENGPGSAPGWYVDDIRIINQAVVDMRSALHNASGVLISYSDTTTIIVEQASCIDVSIAAQPDNANVCAGSNAVFTVSVNGTQPEIQWQVSTDGGATWAPLGGQTSTTLTLNAVTGGMNNNQYRVVVNNACPSSATSQAAILTVGTPAAITAQPAAVTVCSGEGASFSVTTTGTGVTYQWQQSTDGGSTWSDISGATSSTHNINNVATSDNGNRYRVLVTGCAGVITSNAATLTVNETVSITTQPASVNVCSGGDGVFNVVAIGSSPTYQWQVSTDGGATWTNVPGATADGLTINNVTTAQHNNQYRVLINNICGTPVTSTSATLTVSEAAAITGEPVAQTICAGDNTTFSVTATGSANTYQWQVSTDGGTTWSDVSGATSTSLNLNAVSTSFNGNRYRVVVTSCAGALNSSAVTLTVNEPVSITTQPADVAACENGDATFNVVAAGTSNTYQWQVSTDGGTTWNDVPGANTASLTLNNVNSTLQNNRYRAVISNVCTASLNTNPATLTITANASITTPPADDEVCEGEDATFSVVAAGVESYQWQLSTDGGNTWNDISGATAATLTVTSTTSAMNNNRYRVVITGCGTTGVTSPHATITVNNAATITAQPTAQSGCVGATVNYAVSVNGVSLTYQWQVSTDGGNTWNNIAGETNTNLSVNIANASMHGNQYRALINGLCTVNAASDAATLTIPDAVEFVQHPQNLTACENGSITFTVEANNANGYQWQVSTDGGATFNDIAGETAAALTLNPATQAMDNNQYRVVVTGNCEDAVSSAATLTITNTPVIGVVGPTADVCAGSTITLSGTGAATYTWSHNVTDGVPFVINQTTTFNVTGTVGQNCSGTGSITVTVLQPPVVTLSPSSSELDPGETVVLTATANPAATEFAWYRNGVLIAAHTGNTLTVTEQEPGTYTVTTEGANGCTGTSNAAIITLADPIETFISPNPNYGSFVVRYNNTGTSVTTRTLAVYDSKGARVYMKNFPVTPGTMIEKMEVELQTKSSGVYIVALFENGKVVKSGRVMVKN